MAVKLPIKQPPITSYQYIALPLTVAIVNPTAENWFYSNYIQVSCVNRGHYLSKGNCDNALHYAFYNPEITFQESNDHICIEGCEQLYLFRSLSFIKEAIDDGWYIYTDADMFFIDGSDGFEKTHLNFTCGSVIRSKLTRLLVKHTELKQERLSAKSKLYPRRLPRNTGRNTGETLPTSLRNLFWKSMIYIQYPFVSDRPLRRA